MGHKEKRIIRYFLIPAVLLVIGLCIFYFAGKPVADILVADIKYAAIQGDIQDEQTNNSVKFSEITEGTVDSGDFTAPSVGKQYGVISCEKVGMSVPLYYGDTSEILECGAGQSLLSVFPGQTGTTLVGGHDTTFFAPLEQVEEGMDIVVKTTYGQFKYSVDKIEIIKGSDYHISEKGNQLVLYTCYPFGSVSDNRSEKILYTCSLTDGPVIGGSIDEK